MEKKYNIRVYGILKNDKNEVLVTDEYRMGLYMTKFPGGGLESGEGLIECLQREWKEELNVEILVDRHFYTTDFYVKSAFNDSQILSIYYLVKLKTDIQIPTASKTFDFEKIEGAQTFRWIALTDINESMFLFPIDKKVALLLKERN
jgi:8-oxo-dGTP diphosphatase